MYALVSFAQNPFTTYNVSIIYWHISLSIKQITYYCFYEHVKDCIWTEFEF